MSSASLKVDPARASALVSQIQGVNERIAAVAKGRPVSTYSTIPQTLFCPFHPFTLGLRNANNNRWLISS